jgi:flagellar biosynthesis GTPase FlhF
MRTKKQSGKAPQQAFQRGLTIAAAVAAMAGTAACTSAVAQSPAAPPSTITPIAATPVPPLTATVGQAAAPAASAPAAGGNTRADHPVPNSSTVLELQQRMQAHELSELRTTYNGAYGASLLFAQSDLTYYVTLFQQKDLWRVIKTANEASAERAYNDFVRQTHSMADLELQRIRLEAQKERAERQIAAQEEKLRGLRTDLEIQRQQQAQAQERQKAARTEADALDVERRAARARVEELQRQIRALETQVNAPFNPPQRHR